MSNAEITEDYGNSEAAAAPVPPEQQADSPGTCPSNTYLESSQKGDSQVLPGVCGIDWFEVNGIVEWGDDSHTPLEYLDAVRRGKLSVVDQEKMGNHSGFADTRGPFPINLGKYSLLLHEHGMGTRNQTRLETYLEWAGVAIALSSRDRATRQLNNFYYKIAGTPCLILGVEQVRQAVREIVAELGGTIREEWIKRFDVCLDLPGLCLRKELLPAFLQEQFLTSLQDWKPFDGKRGKTGFHALSSKRICLNVYDKRLEVDRHDDVYRQAMIERRWGGTLPESATRIEYQLYRPWLKNLGFDTADDCLNGLNNLVGKLTAGPPRPFFWMTDRIPDRVNKHQSRANVLPSWEQITATFQKWTGPAERVLKPVSRGKLEFKRAWSMVRGILTGIAAKRGVVVETISDLMENVQYLFEVNGADEYRLRNIWDIKARQAGTLDRVMAFP